ncbi:MAG: hypothetical protein EHM85_11930 [Desulfobacteraceae bacterium]|nr:MAG: hypothetical protein EHM85_11930 [Desulfobacteraceae bacterium]
MIPDLPLPKYREPVRLKRLAKKLSSDGRKPSEGFDPIKFPPKMMDEIFMAYALEMTEELHAIDHFRLVYAMHSNLITIMKGREEIYKDLVQEYIANDGFVKSVYNSSKANDRFRTFLQYVYLQKLFIRHQIVRKPHLDFMDKFHAIAKKDKKINEMLKVLVSIRDNKEGFISQFANNCIQANKEPTLYWYDDYGFDKDDYVKENYLDPTEEEIFKLLLSPSTQTDQKKIKSSLEYLIRFSSENKAQLTKRVEKAIDAAESNTNLQIPVLEHLEENLRNPPDWDLVPGISEKARKTYERLQGLVEFRYFELLAEVIYNEFIEEDPTQSFTDKKRLRSRTVFWMNYRDQIDSIKIFINSNVYQLIEKNINKLKKKYNITEKLLDNIGITEIESEIVFILLGDILFIEFFRGTNERNTCIIRNGEKYFNTIIKSSKIRSDDLENFIDKSEYKVRHRHLWQIALFNVLQDEYGIRITKDYVFSARYGTNDFKPEEKPKEWGMNKNSTKVIEEYGDYKGLLNKTIIKPGQYNNWY